jgi:hypothetical protein
MQGSMFLDLGPNFPEAVITNTVLLETQPAVIGQELVGILKMKSVSRKEFTAPAKVGVTVRICVDEGEVAIHGSSTYSNPNVALHDFGYTLIAGSCRNFFSITVYDSADCSACVVSNKRKSGGNAIEQHVVTLYLTIEGTSATESQYSMNSSIGNAFGEHRIT